MSTDNKEESVIYIGTALEPESGLRGRVRELVMKTLVERQLDPPAIKEVMRMTVSGVGEGLAQRGSEAGTALLEAVHGLDEAVSRSVYSVQLALEEVWGQGRHFADQDVRETVDEFRELEDDLLTTLKDSSAKAQGWLKQELLDISTHLGRTGTDTGMRVKAVLEVFNNHLAEVASGAGSEAISTAQEAGSRLTAVASGILRGLADSLDAKHK